MITVYRRTGGNEAAVCELPEAGAKHSRALMGKDEVTVDVVTDEALDLKELDYIHHQDVVYTLNRPPEFTKASEIERRYKLVFEAPSYDLLDKAYTHPITGQTRFRFTGTLGDFAALVVSCANEIGSGWSLGEVPVTPYKNILFESMTCGDVLNKLVGEFSVEYAIFNKNIIFYDRYERDTDFSFEQGRGKGLYTLSVKNVDTDNTITRAYLFGGTQNLPFGYRGGSEYLRWSDPQTGKMYVEDYTDYKKTVERDVVFDEIYPQFQGPVDGVRGDHNHIIRCNDIDFNLLDYLIGGVTAKVNFLTGDLSGLAFELQYDNDAREVTLIYQEDESAMPDADGVRPMLPNDNRKPQIGDRITFTDIIMPDEYVARAENELHEEGVKWLQKNSQLRIKIDLSVDHRYLRDNDMELEIGDLIRVITPEQNLDRRLRIIGMGKKLSDGSFTCEVSNYPKYSWEKEMEAKVESARQQVDAAKSGVSSLFSISKEWTYRHFARLFGGNKLFGRQDIQGDLAVDGNVTVGEFITGMIGGRGAALTVDEATGRSTLEIDRIHAREELIVPKITFNCIDVISGDKANTFAFGTFKTVDTKNRIAELDLLDDQLGTLRVNDICRGVFHNLAGGNRQADSADTNGFLNYAGFSTAYFTPSEILENGPGVFRFRYTLQPDTTTHPSPGMNFYAYGNFTDPDRQAMTYETRYYTRRLKNVNTWVIEPTRNISMQDGLLEGLTIGGMEMHGYGTFQENTYLTGVNIQFTPSQIEQLQGKSAYNVSLSSYERVVKLDAEGNPVSLYEELNVTAGDKNVTSGDENVVTSIYNLSTRIQAWKGETELLYAEAVDKNKYVVVVTATGCTASVSGGVLTINEITDYESCYVDLKINCEGNAVFDKRFSVTVVRNGDTGPAGDKGSDGTSPIIADLDNEFVAVAVNASGAVVAGLPVTINASLYKGSTKLSLYNMGLTKNSGITADYNASAGTITISAIAASVPDVSTITVTLRSEANGGPYIASTTITVSKIRPGADGQNAVLYSLQPSVSTIHKDGAGNYDVAKISCRILKTDGTAQSVVSLPSGYTMDYMIDGAAPKTYTPENELATSAITKNIVFRLYRQGGTITMVDSERVLVLSDGTDGEDGRYTELRYRDAFERPATPTGINPAGWSLSPDTVGITLGHSGNFTLDGVYYASPATTANNATYKQRVAFTTVRDNQVLHLEVAVSSEAGHDYGIVTRLDEAYTTTGTYLWSGSGIMTQIVEIPVPVAGAHFVEIVYKKDASGKANDDRFRYRQVTPRLRWLSSAVIDPNTGTAGAWSTPVIFPTDTPGEEQVYLLAKSDITADMPASDPHRDEAIGDATAYDSTKAYAVGNIVKYNGAYKVCIRAATGIAPTNATYWEDCGWWTDNPTGASAAFPYEYICVRRFSDGAWGDYGKYRLFMHFGVDGVTPVVTQLVPSVTQIGRTLTGSYEPESFSVAHKDTAGQAVAAYMAVWGSQDGATYTRVGTVEKVSVKSVNVAQFPYKYFVIRTYATATATWASEYLLSTSVNVLAPGEKGDAGAMPVYCGFYDGAVEYTYTNNTRDIINYEIGGAVYVFQVKVHGSTVTVPPTSATGDANWEPANKFKFVAMDTALIDGANIAGFMYKNLLMVSRLGTLDGVEIDIKDVPDGRLADFQPHIQMDGNTGAAVFNRVLIRGSLSEPFRSVSLADAADRTTIWNWQIDDVLERPGLFLTFYGLEHEGKTIRVFNNGDGNFNLYFKAFRVDFGSTPGGFNRDVTAVIPPGAVFEGKAMRVTINGTDQLQWLILCRYTYEPSTQKVLVKRFID